MGDYRGKGGAAKGRTFKDQDYVQQFSIRDGSFSCFDWKGDLLVVEFTNGVATQYELSQKGGCVPQVVTNDARAGDRARTPAVQRTLNLFEDEETYASSDWPARPVQAQAPSPEAAAAEKGLTWQGDGEHRTAGSQRTPRSTEKVKQVRTTGRTSSPESPAPREKSSPRRSSRTKRTTTRKRVKPTT